MYATRLTGRTAIRTPATSAMDKIRGNAINKLLEAKGASNATVSPLDESLFFSENTQELISAKDLRLQLFRDIKGITPENLQNLVNTPDATYGDFHRMRIRQGSDQSYLEEDRTNEERKQDRIDRNADKNAKTKLENQKILDPIRAKQEATYNNPESNPNIKNDSRRVANSNANSPKSISIEDYFNDQTKRIDDFEADYQKKYEKSQNRITKAQEKFDQAQEALKNKYDNFDAKNITDEQKQSKEYETYEKTNTELQRAQKAQQKLADSKTTFNDAEQEKTNKFIDEKVGTQDVIAERQDFREKYNALSAEEKVDRLKNDSATKKAVEEGWMTKQGESGFGSDAAAELQSAREAALKQHKDIEKGYSKWFDKHKEIRETLGKEINETGEIALGRKGLGNSIKNTLSHNKGKVAAGLGVLATAGLVFAMNDSRGQQTNAQLYGQQPAYSQ